MTDAPCAPPTVLIVEDEALIAMLLEDTLAGAGYRPLLAPDGRAAPPCPAAGGTGAAPQAAVVGLRLAGGLDGREVVGRLRERNPSMPVVVVTGFDPRAPEADLRGLGGPIVRLGKPFDCHELLERLADLLGGGPAGPGGAHAAASARFRRSDPGRAVSACPAAKGPTDRHC
jgi:DNA-binding response OmpR family regulator